MSLPKYDVVICVKDMAEYIGETLQNVLDAQVPPEVIYVIDDGSNDDTADIASRFKRVVVFRNGVNKGKSYSRNLGITQSTSTFIQLIDADDLLAPDKTRLQLEYLLSHPELDAVFGDVNQFVVVNGEKQFRDKHVFDADTDWLEDLIKKNRIALHAYLFRRSYFEKAGLFDERFPISQDRELWIRALIRGAKIAYQAGPLAHYRRHETSTIASQQRKAAFYNAESLRIHADALYALEQGKYALVTATTLRMLARNANRYLRPMSEVDLLLHDASRSGLIFQIPQKAVYTFMERLFGARLVERLLRPKFYLDHKLGRYEVKF